MLIAPLCALTAPICAAEGQWRLLSALHSGFCGDESGSSENLASTNRPPRFYERPRSDGPTVRRSDGPTVRRSDSRQPDSPTARQTDKPTADRFGFVNRHALSTPLGHFATAEPPSVPSPAKPSTGRRRRPCIPSPAQPCASSAATFRQSNGIHGAGTSVPFVTAETASRAGDPTVLPAPPKPSSAQPTGNPFRHRRNLHPRRRSPLRFRHRGNRYGARRRPDWDG
ncbi:MAG: hypothetical protein QOJ19_3076 [Acidimicrobiia bacterium]|jgi:hypothetical protein|nr:hypothetical protein [Acidimicrobiia bacterium]